MAAECNRFSDTQADVVWWTGLTFCLALYENKTYYLHNLASGFFGFLVYFPQEELTSSQVMFFQRGLFSFKEGIPSLLGDTLAQICSCLPGGQPTKKIALLLKEDCEQLSHVGSNCNPHIWVTSSNCHRKAHNYKILHPLIKAHSQCVAGVKPRLSSMSTVCSQAQRSRSEMLREEYWCKWGVPSSHLLFSL